MAPALSAQLARLACVARLRQYAPEGSTVFAVMRSRSARRFDLYAVVKGQPVLVTWWAASALRWGYCGIFQGLRVPGRRPDLGTFTVESLAEAIHGNSDKLNLRWL